MWSRLTTQEDGLGQKYRTGRRGIESRQIQSRPVKTKAIPIRTKLKLKNICLRVKKEVSNVSISKQ